MTLKLFGHVVEENFELLKERFWVSYAKRNIYSVLALLGPSDFRILYGTVTQKMGVL